MNRNARGSLAMVWTDTTTLLVAALWTKDHHASGIVCAADATSRLNIQSVCDHGDW